MGAFALKSITKDYSAAGYYLKFEREASFSEILLGNSQFYLTFSGGYLGTLYNILSSIASGNKTEYLFDSFRIVRDSNEICGIYSSQLKESQKIDLPKTLEVLKSSIDFQGTLVSADEDEIKTGNMDLFNKKPPVSPKVQYLRKRLETLRAPERLEVFQGYCMTCGDLKEDCQCSVDQ